jgi:hypothetical protein
MQEAISEQFPEESAEQIPKADAWPLANLRRKNPLAIAQATDQSEASQTPDNKTQPSEMVSITTPYIVRLARGQLIRMLKGRAREAVKEKISDAKGKTTLRTQMLFPSEKDMLTAMSMVLDRAIPKADERTGGNTTNIFNFDPRSSIKIAEIVTQAAGQLSAQPQITQQPPAQAQAQVIEVEGNPTPDNW